MPAHLTGHRDELAAVSSDAAIDETEVLIDGFGAICSEDKFGVSANAASKTLLTTSGDVSIVALDGGRA